MAASSDANEVVERRRLHACKVCQRAFVRAEHLQRHLLSHDNNKANKCKACDARFARSDVLRRHTRKCASYTRMIEVAGGTNGDTDLDMVTVVQHQQAENAQSTDFERSGSLGSNHTQHQTGAEVDTGQHDDSGRSRSTASVPTDNTSGRRNMDHNQIFPQLATPANNMYAQPSTLKPSQYNVVSSGRSFMSLDACGTMDQLFADHSSTTATHNANSGDPWSQARSDGDIGRQVHANAPDPVVSTFGDDYYLVASRPGEVPSLPGGSAFMESESQTMAMPDLSSAFFGDDQTFLESILLPEYVFNATGFTTPVALDLPGPAAHPLPIGNETDASQSRLFLPRLPPLLEKATDQPTEVRYPHVFDISAADVEQFQKNIMGVDTRHQLEGFLFPKRSRILRCLSAYFDCVDPHMPIIQHATFSLCLSSPALVLAMLAMGATITSEQQFAISAYEAACTLLEYKLELDKRVTSSFEFWPIQTLLLCVHYGAFSDNKTYSQRSEDRLRTVSKMLGLGLDDLNAHRTAPMQDWQGWSFVETFARLASWTCSLSAILLAYDHSLHINAPHHLRHVPLPLDEDLWRARSAQEWLLLGGSPHRHSSLNFLTLAESLFQGAPIPGKVSCFGLFSLIGWMLLYICNHERVTISVGLLDMFEADFTSKIDKGLGAWETLTRRHLRTGQVMFRQLNPLISDSFPLLGSAYYHLFVGEQLRVLKAMAYGSASADEISTPKMFPRLGSRLLAYKAVRYAANSCLVRAKLGISHFQQSPDAYGSHGAMGAYEAALVLSWWLTVGQVAQTPEGLSSEEHDLVKATKQVLEEVFAEVEDQDVPCHDEAARMLAPLMFCRRTMDRCAFPYTNSLRQALDNFELHVRRHALDG